jgi:hypothetical protein
LTIVEHVIAASGCTILCVMAVFLDGGQHPIMDALSVIYVLALLGILWLRV